ncbi:MAG TPA: hypothetical protein VFQ86_08475 [Arachidicoccus soli]|nr:hypothetical protein [Arachidicoccus soli]
MTEIEIVKKSDSRLGMLAALIYVLLTLFFLFFITYSVADPPKITVPLPVKMGDVGISDFQVDNGGGGSPSKTITTNPDNSNNPKKQATQEQSSVQVPSGTGKSNQQGKVTNTAASNNPFSGTGTGGSGTSGTGTGFGNDNGPGGGTGNPGVGGGGNRKLLSHSLPKPKTINDETGVVVFNLTVDALGKVLRADVNRQKTTIDNQKLIDEIKSMVLRDVHYSKKSGAQNVIISYSVSVYPN